MSALRVCLRYLPYVPALDACFKYQLVLGANLGYLYWCLMDVNLSTQLKCLPQMFALGICFWYLA